MSLIQLRDAIIVGLKQIDGLKSVEAAEGSIGDKELQRLSIRPPGAFVTIMGIREMEHAMGETYRANVQCGVFLVTAGNSRLTDATNMVEQIVLRIADTTWNLPNTQLATDITAETLYDDDSQARGMLLMGISWRQKTRMARPSVSTVDARADDVQEAEALSNTEHGAWPSSLEGVLDP